MTEVELRLPRFETQLHPNLLHLVLTKESAIGWRLADQMVHSMDEADHRIVIGNCDVKRLAITAD